MELWVIDDLRGRGVTSSLNQPMFCSKLSLASPQVQYGEPSSRRRGRASSRQSQISKKSEQTMHHTYLPHNTGTTALIISLRTCAKNKDLMKGSRIHQAILDQGLLETCSDALIAMYAKCGELAKAQELLDNHKSKDAPVWTALIAGYTRQKRYRDALNCFESMQHEGIVPSAVTYTYILKACGSLKLIRRGEQIHDEICRQGLLGKDVVLGTALLDMYAKCGALSKAQHVLEELPSRDVIAWSALITGYVQQGQGKQALTCLERMKWEGLSPDSMTYACILKACSTIGAIEKGELVHAELVKQGLLRSDPVLDTALVDMYAKYGSLAKAHQVLEELPSRDVVSWGALISGYTQQGQGKKALQCLEQMRHEGFSPNAITYACILNACGSIKAADEGEKIHDEIVRQGLLRNDVALGNALVDMYVKCGALEKAQCVLEELPLRDAITWSTIIAGYVQQDQGELALKCFDQMENEGFFPDATTFSCVLKACGIIRAVEKGRQIHDKIADRGFLVGNDKILGIALVEMYAKCGDLVVAQRVFEELPIRDVFAWNALIAGYAQQSQDGQALKYFEQMQCQGIIPNSLTFASILKACGGLQALDKGTQIHDEIMKQGLLEDDNVLGNALVDMYAKCGALEKAQKVFTELPSRDVVSWNSLIAGYVLEGQGEKALNCSVRMQHEGISPDEATYISFLKACGALGAVEKGQKIHEDMDKQGLLRDNVVVGTALVDMYAKCGALSTAARVLEELPFQDAVSWNALIAGYAQHGQGQEALNCLKRMQCKGFLPDAATFSGVLSTCCHLGLLDDCFMYLVEMSIKYGVKPHLEHYTCMVDIFGRAGHLEKAVRMIQEMPSSNHSELWHALLGACQKWRNVEVARWAFEQAVQVNKSDLAAYVLISNIYTASGMHDEAEQIEVMRMANAAS